MASAMAGVPASNRMGGWLKVLWSRKTSWIISPPPIHGGMLSSTSMSPQRNPMPVGPHILWLDAAIQSAPSAWTSTGMCGTDWHASSSTLAPTALARHTIVSTSFTHPKVLLTCCRATSLVFGPTRLQYSSMSSPSSWSSPTNLSTAPLRAARSCQGTRLEWCSATLSTISSPSPMFSSPHVHATRLMASDALRVKTTSLSLRAPTKAATLARAASYASVARAESVWTPLWTLLFMWR
mmetsp:Transcript_18153/g.51202  ORF Transcript_18153/g.51202 Transcript_18153/m.51202 type:complete len:238 (+) Transcript_18153:542-1255(+)